VTAGLLLAVIVLDPGHEKLLGIAMAMLLFSYVINTGFVIMLASAHDFINQQHSLHAWAWLMAITSVGGVVAVAVAAAKFNSMVMTGVATSGCGLLVMVFFFVVYGAEDRRNNTDRRREVVRAARGTLVP
jgi:hypothetical protein